MQKKGGHFILKVFDLFLKSSIDLIFILSCCYKHVFIIKPHTSRLANSEKYIICKHFILGDSSELSTKFTSILKVIENLNDVHIASFLNVDIPHYFMTQLMEINSILGQAQIENINLTISYICNEKKRDNIKHLKNKSIQRCIRWCKNNYIPFNSDNGMENLFLQ